MSVDARFKSASQDDFEGVATSSPGLVISNPGSSMPLTTLTVMSEQMLTSGESAK
jgi:hypothetical protein